MSSVTNVFNGEIMKYFDVSVLKKCLILAYVGHT